MERFRSGLVFKAYIVVSLNSRLGSDDEEAKFFIDILLVRVHCILMIRWTGLAPWEVESPFPGSLTSTFLVIKGSGFRMQGSGFRVQGSGFRVKCSGIRDQGSGSRVQGSGFRVQGSGFRVQGSE